MPTLNDLPITTVVPSDRPHILVWDTCDADGLHDLSFRHGTFRANYRQDLVTRHTQRSSSNYLLLDKRIDREIAAIRDLCENSPKSCVQLEGLDSLITYLDVKSSNDLDLFWQILKDLRQLPKRLWIILPSPIVWPKWPPDRLHHIEAP